MQNIIKRYIRDRKNNLVGVVLAAKEEDKYYVGWSRTKTSAGDKFSKEFGTQVAIGRAKNGSGQTTKVPHGIAPVIAEIKDRAARYFKNCSLVET